jgi:hypothetical protein
LRCIQFILPLFCFFKEQIAADIGVIMADITFDVVKHFGVLSEEKTGWKKEVNLVSWNGRSPKIDIRDWSPGHEKMGKGITLTPDEAKSLMELLAKATETE